MANNDFEAPPGWRVSSGDMANLVRRTDWSVTPLGAQEGWSQSLKLAVGMVLASAFPMALRWGPEFVLIYNDAYRPILGDKHPWALGRPAREAWSEVWPQIAPAHEAILNAKTPSIFADDIILRIQRHGSAWEDAHFTLGYSAIEDLTVAQGVGGILVIAVEITDRVLAEEARRVSEERYELALGAAGAIGAWDWDVVHNRVTTNGTFAKLYSVNPRRTRPGDGASRPIQEEYDDAGTRKGADQERRQHSGRW